MKNEWFVKRINWFSRNLDLGHQKNFHLKNIWFMHLHLWIKAFASWGRNSHLHHEIRVCIYLESICIMSIYIMKHENPHLYLCKGHLHWKMKFKLTLCLKWKKIAQWENLYSSFLIYIFLGHENYIALGKVKDICIGIHDS